MGPYKHEIANLRFENVIRSWIDIFQSSILVFLILHIFSLNINNEKAKKLFIKRTLEISHWPLYTWFECFLNFISRQKRNRNHQMKLFKEEFKTCYGSLSKKKAAPECKKISCNEIYLTFIEYEQRKHKNRTF